MANRGAAASALDDGRTSACGQVRRTDMSIVPGHLNLLEPQRGGMFRVILAPGAPLGLAEIEGRPLITNRSLLRSCSGFSRSEGSNTQWSGRQDRQGCTACTAGGQRSPPLAVI